MNIRRSAASIAAGVAVLALVPTSGTVNAAGKGTPVAQVCPGTKYQSGATYGPFAWGTITVEADHIDYDITAGYQVTLCVKGGPTNTTATFTGPATGELLTPTLKNGKHAALSHWSVVSATTVGP